MATVTLGSKAEGSIIKLKENGVLVDFYIAKQNYESGLNGAGRVLVVRKDCYDQRQWQSNNVNAYASSDIDAWLNSTYKNLLDANIRQAMGTTKIYYTPGNNNWNVTILERPVFLLSATELGQTHPYLKAEGTALSSTVLELLKIARLNGSAVNQWTRSPGTSGTSVTWHLFPSGKLNYSNGSSTYGSRPAFTLPSSLYVSDDGFVFVNTAPSTPSSIAYPSRINGGTNITVSWGASMDAEGNLAGYIVERSTNGGSSWTQIYQGSAQGTTNNVAFGTASVMFRVKAYDTEGLNSGWKTGSNITVVNNQAPTAPGSITVPNTVLGGSTITVSWGASTDAQNNLEGYILERSTNGGSAWARVYQGASTSTTNSVAFGTESVMYRVKAYDAEGLESGYKTSGQVTVINNTAPGSPASITVPLTVTGGGSLTVTWAAATDPEGNLTGYVLERKVGSGEWAQVFKGNALAYQDTITKGWASVAYRVKAYDRYNAESAYTTSKTRTVDNNTAPTIACDQASGADLGTKGAGFAVSYSVGDVDSDTVTVTEAIDGVTKRTFTATLDGSNSFSVTGECFMKLLNGDHTLTITANDGKASTVHTLTFKKEVTEASITLETPMTADAQITICVLSVSGFIPADAEYKVEVTNNANDTTPVWEDCTAEVKKSANHIFENKMAANGFAFNFRITAERGTSGEGGYITSVQGGFQ